MVCAQYKFLYARDAKYWMSSYLRSKIVPVSENRNVRVQQIASLNKVRTALISRTIANDGTAAAATTPNVKTDKLSLTL